MKKIIYFSLCMFFINLHFPNINCQTVKNDKDIVTNKSKVDFLKHVNPEWIWIYTISTRDTIPSGKETYAISIPYYEELSIPEIKIGDATLFAVPKTYPEQWQQKLLPNKCKDIRCFAKQLFKENITILKQSFELYTFFIDKKDLEDPIYEEAEGGTFVGYYPKKGSTVIVYKYLNNEWIEVDRIKQKETEDWGPRTIGQRYIKEKIFFQLYNQLK